MVDATLVLPEDRLLAFEGCLTFREYCELQEERDRLLRMRYAETRLEPSLQLKLNACEEPLNILAVVTDEDPDTVAVLPIVARMVDASPRLQLRVLSESRDLTPLVALLPGVDALNAVEEWVLPQFLIFDDEWELQAQWGPRPSQAEGNLSEWLSRYPEYETLADDETPAAQRRYAALTTALTYEMRVWYNSSLATACQQEFCDTLLAIVQSEESDEEQFV